MSGPSLPDPSALSSAAAVPSSLSSRDGPTTLNHQSIDSHTALLHSATIMAALLIKEVTTTPAITLDNFEEWKSWHRRVEALSMSAGHVDIKQHIESFLV